MVKHNIGQVISRVNLCKLIMGFLSQDIYRRVDLERLVNIYLEVFVNESSSIYTHRCLLMLKVIFSFARHPKSAVLEPHLNKWAQTRKVDRL